MICVKYIYFPFYPTGRVTSWQRQFPWLCLNQITVMNPPRWAKGHREQRVRPVWRQLRPELRCPEITTGHDPKDQVIRIEKNRKLGFEVAGQQTVPSVMTQHLLWWLERGPGAQFSALLGSCTPHALCGEKHPPHCSGQTREPQSG